MTKNYIPTINISSLVKNNFETQSALKTIKEIEKACVKVGFFQITGHGLNLKDIKKVCDVGNKFFNLPGSKKRQLSPKKWNKKNKNLYRGYFPNDVNGKEGLDIGDLKVTKKYSSKLKNQYMNIGISEQAMASIAAGMALEGKKVFIFSITPFVTQRCLEQIKLDICLSNLPVTIVGNGSSLTYATHGPSHQAIEDLGRIMKLIQLCFFSKSTGRPGGREAPQSIIF